MGTNAKPAKIATPVNRDTARANAATASGSIPESIIIPKAMGIMAAPKIAKAPAPAAIRGNEPPAKAAIPVKIPTATANPII